MNERPWANADAWEMTEHKLQALRLKQSLQCHQVSYIVKSLNLQQVKEKQHITAMFVCLLLGFFFSMHMK